MNKRLICASILLMVTLTMSSQVTFTSMVPNGKSSLL